MKVYIILSQIVKLMVNIALPLDPTHTKLFVKYLQSLLVQNYAISEAELCLVSKKNSFSVQAFPKYFKSDSKKG